MRAPVVLAINKIDLLNDGQREALARTASRRASSSPRRPATASMRSSRGSAALLPESPFLYPDDEISTQTVRFFVE